MVKLQFAEGEEKIRNLENSLRQTTTQLNDSQADLLVERDRSEALESRVNELEEKGLKNIAELKKQQKVFDSSDSRCTNGPQQPKAGANWWSIDGDSDTEMDAYSNGSTPPRPRSHDNSVPDSPHGGKGVELKRLTSEISSLKTTIQELTAACAEKDSVLDMYSDMSKSHESFMCAVT